MFQPKLHLTERRTSSSATSCSLWGNLNKFNSGGNIRSVSWPKRLELTRIDCSTTWRETPYCSASPALCRLFRFCHLDQLSVFHSRSKSCSPFLFPFSPFTFFFETSPSMLDITSFIMPLTTISPFFLTY